MLKKIRYLSLLFCFLPLFAVAEDRSEKVSSAVHGRWIQEQPGGGQGAAVVFESPGLYSVDLNDDGKVDIKGIYLIEGGVIVLRDTQIDSQGCASTDGAYRFSISNDMLSFSLIKDSCSVRSEALSHSWRKQAP